MLPEIPRAQLHSDLDAPLLPVLELGPGHELVVVVQSALHPRLPHSPLKVSARVEDALALFLPLLPRDWNDDDVRDDALPVPLHVLPRSLLYRSPPLCLLVLPPIGPLPQSYLSQLPLPLSEVLFLRTQLLLPLVLLHRLLHRLLLRAPLPRPRVRPLPLPAPHPTACSSPASLQPQPRLGSQHRANDQSIERPRDVRPRNRTS
mmetsp:Transcript_348/g.957  ORF Transcript_348/g.957 Transcript_348/m.957 type:complete len:204 (+) Transcript_348:848-1459(+)